jgi:hypothetical protein
VFARKYTYKFSFPPCVDNNDRANRVQQLASDIAHLQTDIKEDVADANFQYEKAVKVLDQVSKNLGHKTLDEYIADAMAKLSPADKEKYQDMKKELEAKDDAIDLSMKVATGIAGLGFTVGLSGVYSLPQSFKFSKMSLIYFSSHCRVPAFPTKHYDCSVPCLWGWLGQDLDGYELPVIQYKAPADARCVVSRRSHQRPRNLVWSRTHPEHYP